MNWNLMILRKMNEARRNGDWTTYFILQEMFE